ncbi:MAG: IS66 family transposase [Candidatus Woesearchaeota archaeon]
MTTQEKELEKLRRENQKLLKEIEDKNQIIKHIEQEKKRIEKEFEEFKTKHTSTVRQLQKALKIKPNLQHRPKPIGAKKNHKGYGRKTPVNIDREEELIPNRCPHCHQRLKSRTVSVRERFVTTIQIINPAEVIKYLLHRKWCSHCKQLVEPEVPGVLPNAHLSLNIMLLVMYLQLALRVPGAKICEYFSTIHGIHISAGEIPNILRQLAREYGDYYCHLEKLIKLARVKYTDSTGWRIKGKKATAWVFVAAGTVIYKIRKSCNHKTPLQVLGRAIQGMTLVVDRHSAFRTLARKAGYFLQLCWSHILEDSKELSVSFGREGTYVHKRLKQTFQQAKSLNHQATPEQVDQLCGEILQLTNRHYKHITIRRFVNNLAFRDIDDLFRFTTDPSIDPTNNLSERELRHLVMIRRSSHGSRSPRGAAATAQLTSIIQTLKLRKENVLQGLQNILNQIQTTE